METCKHFVNDVLPEIEKVMVVHGKPARIKRMELIEAFLSSIGCTPWHPTPPDPTLEHPGILEMAWRRMSNPVITGYPQLIGCVFTDDIVRAYIISVQRQESFRGITCSDYIEGILVDLLDKFNRPENININKCINLLMCPMKAHFQQFIMKYTRSPGSTEMPSSNAMKHYETFMSLSTAIIEKKIEMFAFPSLEGLEETPNIIISLLLIRFAMIRDLLSKIETEKGFTGIDYNKMVNIYFQASITLYRSYLGEIERQIQQFEERIEMLQTSINHSTRLLGIGLGLGLGNQNEDDTRRERETIQRNEETIRQQLKPNLSTLKRMREELSAIGQLTEEIGDLHRRASVKTQADTPQRPPRALRPPPQQDEEEDHGGGVRHKRMKKNNFKTKKYKKNNSKSKKYKKNYFKSKKYKKLLF
jgi:hypothetical protein